MSFEMEDDDAYLYDIVKGAAGRKKIASILSKKDLSVYDMDMIFLFEDDDA